MLFSALSTLGLVSTCPYEKLRVPYERESLLQFFATRPLAVTGRAVDFAAAYRRCRNVWENADGERARGELLRQEVAALGPVAVKFGQTLSQRPDVLPDDVCEALKSLQMSNKKFDNAQAMQMLDEELPAGANEFFAHIDPDPIAAASLGQVYRATTHDGVRVAVKVQRPEAMRQVALDVATCVVLGDLVVSLGLFPADRELDRIIDTAAAGVSDCSPDPRSAAPVTSRTHAARFRSALLLAPRRRLGRHALIVHLHALPAPVRTPQVFSELDSHLTH
jgi:predicted unusual protein kinase regulating ubiquinone biosynthesis (AarF/ABC1/UbiB family)